ncbi:MAG TPA: phosphoglycerate dehydrogenase [Lentisphaeria bacterium]|nr:MAG: hypothetical protein A2X48_17040 [Lentisphaerae bacterium GWF2_49_21]HBC88369.1 phosphoglycerate dehydrogenase [Lentisphaeria bacterium]
MKKITLILSDNPAKISEVFGKQHMARLKSLVELHPEILSRSSLGNAGLVELFGKTEILVSTWGFPALTKEELNAFPELKIVLYAAGTVKYFAEPFLERGITVVSAWQANAVPVAEFSLAQILLSCKGYFRNIRESRNPETRLKGKCFAGRGIYGETVGLIGCGAIARALIGLLKAFNLKVVVFDPYLSDSDVEKLGVEKVELLDLFKRAYVVSNHLPNLPSTKSMLDRRCFESMRESATFINTGRGAQVVEQDLIDELKKRPSLCALLDVTFPEPPPADSEMYRLPNLHLSSHIAGSLNDELGRMAEYVIGDLERWLVGKPLQYQIAPEMFRSMA